MTDDLPGCDVAEMREGLAALLGVPAEQIEGAIIIAAMGDGEYMLLHSASSTAMACEVAMEVFKAKPHYHDQVIGVLL